MGPLEPVGGTARVLQANFDAFKFPTSELVQFRALVTPCIPHCQPVSCHLTGHRPGPDTFTSYGKRRRREAEDDFSDITEEKEEKTAKEEEGMLVASAMRIVDNFPFTGRQESADDAESASAACSLGNRFPLSVAWISLIACQAVLLVAFVAACIRRRRWYLDSGGGAVNCVCQSRNREELASDTSSIYMTDSSRSKWTFHLDHHGQD
jgi:hypothetical protein